MKDNKKANMQCHQEHVLILNSLTESLREELKRGLTLMDNCVNQLAQAKWILINVEKTIEDSYAQCPACDPSNRKQLEGNTATSPPSSVPSNPLLQSNGLLSCDVTLPGGGKKAKARKASILPMVSGHTIQRPNLNIARIDAKGSRKQKAKNDSPPQSSGSRIRARGQGAALLASATASAGTGFVSPDSDIEEVATTGRTGENRVDNDKKKKAGPMSRTRAVTLDVGANIDGTRRNQCDKCSINLSDIKDDLNGKIRLVGDELANFMKAKGMTIDFKIKPHKDTDNESLPDIKSDDSDEGSSVSKKKMLMQKKESTLSNLTREKKQQEASAAPSGGDKTKNIAVLQSSLLSFTTKHSKASMLAKLQAAVSKAAAPESKTGSDEPKTTASAGRAGKKAHSDSDSDSDGSEKRKEREAASPARKKTKIDSEDDSDAEVIPVSKRSVRQSSVTERSVAKKSLASDESDVEIKAKKRPVARKGKKGGSSDDSDPEFMAGSKKSRSKKTPLPTRKSGVRIKSKEIIIDSSDDEDEKESKKSESREKSSDSRVKHENSDEDSAKSEKSGATESVPKPSDPIASKSRPGPASQKAKRSGGRPGPLSSKATQDKSDESPSKSEKEGHDKDVEDVIANIAQKKMFESESEDSELEKIKSSIRIPLNLQDAARSPSPDGPTDVFGRLLSSYNPVAKSALQKLKERCNRLNSRVYELDDDLQEKLSKAGRELIPYDGSFSTDDHSLESGKYYIVGKHPDEKLVLFESSELQKLEMSDDELDDLMN